MLPSDQGTLRSVKVPGKIIRDLLLLSKAGVVGTPHRPLSKPRFGVTSAESHVTNRMSVTCTATRVIRVLRSQRPHRTGAALPQFLIGSFLNRLQSKFFQRWNGIKIGSPRLIGMRSQPGFRTQIEVRARREASPLVERAAVMEATAKAVELPRVLKEAARIGAGQKEAAVAVLSGQASEEKKDIDRVEFPIAEFLLVPLLVTARTCMGL